MGTMHTHGLPLCSIACHILQALLLSVDLYFTNVMAVHATTKLCTYACVGGNSGSSSDIPTAANAWKIDDSRGNVHRSRIVAHLVDGEDQKRYVSFAVSKSCASLWLDP